MLNQLLYLASTIDYHNKGHWDHIPSSLLTFFQHSGYTLVTRLQKVKNLTYLIFFQVLKHKNDLKISVHLDLFHLHGVTTLQFFLLYYSQGIDSTLYC